MRTPHDGAGAVVEGLVVDGSVVGGSEVEDAAVVEDFDVGWVLACSVAVDGVGEGLGDEDATTVVGGGASAADVWPPPQPATAVNTTRPVAHPASLPRRRLIPSRTVML